MTLAVSKSPYVLTNRKRPVLHKTVAGRKVNSTSIELSRFFSASTKFYQTMSRGPTPSRSRDSNAIFGRKQKITSLTQFSKFS